jgi:predicted TIM-barrel fold metal-dependent hydrolase
MDGFVQEVIGTFGAGRTMWGSNYPECGSVSDYERDLALVTNRRWGLTDDQVDQICGRTAQRVWFGQGATAR